MTVLRQIVAKRCSASTLILWLFYTHFIVPVCHTAPSTTADCTSNGGGECSIAASQATMPPPVTVNGVLHRIANVQVGVSAVDMCLIVSAAQTMRMHQRWLQIAVPQLEQELTSMGIGNETDKPNRYCVVQFGGSRTQLRGHFILVNGEEFFPAGSFVLARRELKRSGDVADGYEAIEFALNNAPFRDDSTVKKIMLLVSNMGRSVLATSSNLTRDVILSMLSESSVSLDTVISAEFEIQGQSSSSETVIGQNGVDTGTAVRPDGGYEFVDGAVTHYSSQGQTIHDYVNLSLAAGSSSWSINVLAQENTSVILSFVRSFIASHRLERLKTVEVCQACRCADESGGSPFESCHDLVCGRHDNQELCRCLVTRTPSECVVINPTPVTPTVTTASSSTGIIETAAPLLLQGNLEQYPGGEVEVIFDSDRSKANYHCVLLDGTDMTPPVIPCESRYYLKNLSSGQYELLVVGKRKEHFGSLLFHFTIENDDICEPEIRLSTSQGPNSSVAVNFHGECFSVTHGARERVQFQCSIAGRQFTPCSSPVHISYSDFTVRGADFIIVAQDWRGKIIARVLHIETPTLPPPPGPVMIGIVRVDPPDPFGKVVIHFNTTDPSAICGCKVNQTAHSCSTRKLVADPRELGEGVQNVTISCYDSMGYVAIEHIKLSLHMPPSPPSGPLSCDLNLRGPTEDGILIVAYTCDRLVIATCQIAQMAPESCNLPPSGQYEINITSLEPGPHLFIITLDDGYGKSVMKIHPFFIGTAHRKCCPLIARNSTLTSDLNTATLSLSAMAGNCSKSEGFKYMVDWGDGASECGTSTELSDIQTSRVYDSSGNYTVEVSFCNNPVSRQNSCCDAINFNVNL